MSPRRHRGPNRRRRRRANTAAIFRRVDTSSTTTVRAFPDGAFVTIVNFGDGVNVLKVHRGKTVQRMMLLGNKACGETWRKRLRPPQKPAGGRGAPRHQHAFLDMWPTAIHEYLHPPMAAYRAEYMEGKRRHEPPSATSQNCE